MNNKIRKVILSGLTMSFIFLTIINPAFAATYNKESNVVVNTSVGSDKIFVYATYTTASSIRWNIRSMAQKVSGSGTSVVAQQVVKYDVTSKGVEIAYQKVNSQCMAGAMSFYSNARVFKWSFDETNQSKGIQVELKENGFVIPSTAK